MSNGSAPQDVQVVSVPEWERLKDAFTGLATKQTHRIVVRREAVPIVFVPGIMGTRLANKKSGEKVWDPDASVFMLWNYGMFFVSAEDKKDMVIGRRFDPDYLRVYHDDDDHNEEYLEGIPHAVARGWGGVSWATYGPFLQRLYAYRWPGLVGKVIATPVYCFGYNWSASAADAGERLEIRIRRIIEHQQKIGNRCDKVILVTHSMGGLVARAACKLFGADANVLGVVHGVQPTTGAPAAYWRMRAGFERPGFFNIKGRLATFVLGANGQETTALLGNMPGGLQLLPTKDYRHNDNGASWLTVYNESKQALKKLPSSASAPNPYSDIYREQHAFWRLVNPAFLDPGAQPEPSANKKAAGVRPDDPWHYYTSYLDEAEGFHDQLKVQYFDANTEIFYGKGTAHPSADRIGLTCGRYVPTNDEIESGRILKRGTPLTPADEARLTGFRLLEGLHDWDCRGGFKAHVVDRATRTAYTVELAEPAGSGDGTVPESSGKILESKGARATPIDDVEHEPAFQPDEAWTIVEKAIGRMLKELVKRRLGAAAQ